jgi:mannose/cellobiose epimerase-like protein (N-acyl-D-glucosamine 2-epimerase family)
MFDLSASDAPRWTRREAHRAWLRAEANRLFDFFQGRSIDPRGGFFVLDDEGTPLPGQTERPIHLAARAAHCYAAAMLLGRPGASAMVDHAMETLWRRHRDGDAGGYVWSFDADGPRDRSKRAYGHAFVLLAASSARLVGHPRADAMLADVCEVLDRRFWEEAHGGVREELGPDWSPVDGDAYRGQNANMHLCEALMAAFEATGDAAHLARAERIADLIIRRAAAAQGWRVAEHFRADWSVDRGYRCADEQFRPAGVTPGHALEWSRLLLQLFALGGGRLAWAPEAARALFAQAMRGGWDGRLGGFFYTLDWDDKPAQRIKLWWPACEAVGAAHFLSEHGNDPFHEASYRRVWDHLASHVIDPARGGWFEELSEDLRRSQTLFPGKADIYHAVQACLIPLYPATGSLTRAIVAETARGGVATQTDR